MSDVKSKQLGVLLTAMSSSNSCHELQNPPLPANNLDSLKSNAETNNGDDKMMPQCDMVQPVALASKPLSLVSAHCNNNARQTNTIRASTIIKADASKLLHRSTELAPKSTLQASASILEGISLVPLSSKPFLSTSNLANSCTSSSAKKEEKIMPRNDSISNNNKNEHPKNDAISHETTKGLQSQKAKHLQMQHQTQYQSQINSKPLQSQLSQTKSQNHQTSPMPLRRGKWTSEEEAYALTVIREFNAGYLDAHPGTTLRSYLSEKLECDPMRITKKFTGDASIGKKVFHPAIRSELNTKEIEDAQANLESLHEQWKLRLEAQRQETTQKSLADEAVSMASTLCDGANLDNPTSVPSSSPLVADYFPMSVSKSGMRVPPDQLQSTEQKMAHNTITRTVSWLEKAEFILSKKKFDVSTVGVVHSNTPSFIRNDDIGGGRSANDASRLNEELKHKIVHEMSELSRLIETGPAILANSRDLPRLLGKQNEPKSSLQCIEQSIHCNPPSSSDQINTRILSCPARVDHPKQEPLDSFDTIENAKKRKHTTNTGNNIYGEGNLEISPNCPMKLLASLSSQAAPVPIMDEEDDGKRKDKSSFHQMAPLMPSSNHLPDHVGSNWKASKRLKIESMSTSTSTTHGENPQHRANAEDAKTFVNFLQSVVHVRD